MEPQIAVEGMTVPEAYSQLLDKTIKTSRLKDRDGNFIYDYALVRFFPRSDPRDIETVFVGVNGRAYIIKRGEIVPVPVSVVGVAENAQIPVYKTVNDNNVDRKVLAGYRPSYPFEAICGITTEEANGLKALMVARAKASGKAEDGCLTEDDIQQFRNRPAPKNGTAKKAKDTDLQV